MTERLSDEDLDTAIGDGRMTVVDFSADWCAPCRQLAPVLVELAAEFGGSVRIGVLDVDRNPRSRVRYGVRSVPTLLFFKGGELVDRIEGSRTKSALAARLRQLCG